MHQKIIKGHLYKCIKEVPYKHFTLGNVYKCELNDCLVDDRNEDSRIGVFRDCFKENTSEIQSKVYIARDKDNSLWIYESIPTKLKSTFAVSAKDTKFLKIDERMYPNVTWENSPMELITK